MLIPNLSECKRNINKFPKQDFTYLLNFYQSLTGSQNTSDLSKNLNNLQSEIILVLGKWGAFRNQGSKKNDNFLNNLAASQSTLKSLFEILQFSNKSSSLKNIFEKNKKDIIEVYEFLKNNLMVDKPARIVALSKAMLFITGVSLAFDSIVLKKFKKANSNLLCCPGIWPNYLYIEMMEYAAEEQIIWEKKNNIKLISLSQNFGVGHVINMILWEQ